MARWPRTAAVGGAMLLVVVAGGCGNTDEPSVPAIRPVRYEQVVPTRAGVSRTFAGVARAPVESQLSFKVSGNLRAVNVVVGERVDRGSVIAQIDARDYELQVENAEASFKSQQAQAKNARATYERVRGLYENKNAALSELEAALATADSADAAVDAAHKLLEIAQLRQSYTRLVAPATGAITDVRVDVNENVKEGQTIAVLASGRIPEVEVSVPEQLIASVRVNQPVTVSFDAIPEKRLAGRVIEVGVAPTGAATTFPVTVELEALSAEIRPGMTAEVTFTFGDDDPTPRRLVPLAAVGEDVEGHFVYVVEPTEAGFGIIRRRPVSVGDRLLGEGRIDVVDGLQDGELVVTAGVSRIEHGLTVRLLQADVGGR